MKYFCFLLLCCLCGCQAVGKLAKNEAVREIKEIHDERMEEAKLERQQEILDTINANTTIIAFDIASDLWDKYLVKLLIFTTALGGGGVGVKKGLVSLLKSSRFSKACGLKQTKK